MSRASAVRASGEGAVNWVSGQYACSRTSRWNVGRPLISMRPRAALTVREALTDARTLSQINDHLLDVVRANTDALAALREELRSHRISETEWLTRLSRQLEQMTQ